MISTRRVVVLGLYNSGSSAVAGVLHRLGVNMGPPFWANSDDQDENNHYEPYDLSWHLRRWWDEPRAIEQVPAADRIRYLSCWAKLQESVKAGPIGAKHPLLSLCGDDIVAAWGPETRFIWSWRPLDQSISGLQRRGWFRGVEASLQQRLWDALIDFEARDFEARDFEAHHGDVVRLNWNQVKSDPHWAVRELASLVGIAPSEAQLRAAAEFIRVA